MIDEAITLILEERERQLNTWGEQNHDPYRYLAILHEETGELAEAVLKHEFEHGDGQQIQTEAVHVAAVAVALLECCLRGLDRRWGKRAKGAEYAEHTEGPQPFRSTSEVIDSLRLRLEQVEGERNELARLVTCLHDNVTHVAGQRCYVPEEMVQALIDWKQGKGIEWPRQQLDVIRELEHRLEEVEAERDEARRERNALVEAGEQFFKEAHTADGIDGETWETFEELVCTAAKQEKGGSDGATLH